MKPNQQPAHVPGALATIAALYRAYPARSAAVVVLTFLAGMAEAVGVVALLPLLGLAVGSEEDVPAFGDWVSEAAATLGITPSVGVLLVVIVAGIAAKGGLKIAAMRQAGYAAAQVATDLRLGLIRALMHARWRYFTGQPVGSLANAVSSEAQRASTVFTKSCDLLARLIQVAVYVGVAFMVSWQVATITLSLGGLMLLSLSFLVRVSKRAGRRQTELLKSLIARLSDGLYAIKPLKAMGKEDSLQPLLEEETQQLNVAQRRQVISRATLDSSHEPIITLFIAVIIYVLLAQLAVPFSEMLFVAFLFYRTTTYLGTLQKHLQGLVECESAYWSIQAAIQEAGVEEERVGGAPAPRLREELRLAGVTFSYGSKPVLRDCDLRIPAGGLTAVIGPSGAGKTTIADLVTGLYQPDAGAVLVDGADLAGVDLRSWRQRVGYVPQELILFHDTVRVNVAMGDPEVSDDRIEAALRDAGATEFVEGLARGLDTVVGEHGMRLSGGQRQRLAIARALLRAPDLLILDEATTALDPETERSIIAALDRLKGRVTMLAISHQTGIVDAADQVIRVEPGHGGARIEAQERAASESPGGAEAGL